MSTATGSIDAAMQHCRDITRARARNFYYGLKLLPEPKRSSLYAIYAWMRRADDIIDDSDGRELTRIELDRFSETTIEALEGRCDADDPLWIAFTETARTFKLDAAPFLDMLEGQRADLDERSIVTSEDLFTYCRQVASTVGLVCIQVWGYDDSAAPSLAVDRGIAFQLTNILRDIREDVELDRCYIPDQQLKDAGMTPDDLVSWRPADRAESIIEGWIATARSHYERSAPLEEMIDPACRPTLWAMTTIYRELLERIAKDPHRIVEDRRVRLNAIHKTSIALRAKWMARSAGPAK